MNDLELIDRLTGTDVYAKDQPLPRGWSPAVLSAIEHTVATNATDEASTDALTSAAKPLRSLVVQRGWRSAAWVAAAAAAVVIAIGAATSLLTHVDEPFTVDTAATIADDYATTFNSGDTETTMGLFTSNAVFAASLYTGPYPFEIERETFEALMAWWQGQGSVLTSSDCTASAEVSGASVTMVCTSEMLDAPTQLVGAPPVPLTTTMEITPDGIQVFRQEVGQLDFYWVQAPFERWMQEHHFDDREIIEFYEFASTTEGVIAAPKELSREEAANLGRIRAEFAMEWADYLAANGCDYLDPIC